MSSKFFINYLRKFIQKLDNVICNDKDKIVDQIPEVKKFFYDGGKVSKELLEAAIDFMISIEPNPLYLIIGSTAFLFDK